MKISKTKGFTLIELMVVISIISLLSSIVFSALNNARSKAKDAAIKMEVDQLQKLLALEHLDKNSYCGLMIDDKAWVLADDVCLPEAFSGTYSTQALAVCNKIVENVNKSGDYYGFHLTSYDADFNFTCNSNYSIGAYLNSGKYLCASNNVKNEYPSPSYVFDDAIAPKGCYNNP